MNATAINLATAKAFGTKKINIFALDTNNC